MDWRDKMRVGLDVAAMTGAEIGPLNRPAVRKEEGRVLYVDHADAAALRRKYADHPNVDLKRIVEVDVVWGEHTLAQALGPDLRLDYVLASHVVEHVPDLVGWFEELEASLKPGGRVNLVVPDRRFTFDFLREETRLADVIAAHLLRARRPLPQQILDHALNAAAVDLAAAWECRLDPARLKRIHTLDDAVAIARDAVEAGAYHDVHCWVFTPKGFAALCARLAGAGLFRFACERFFDTERHTLEFAVSLRRCADPTAIVTSWHAMRDAARDDPTGPAIGAGAPVPRAQVAWPTLDTAACPAANAGVRASVVASVTDAQAAVSASGRPVPAAEAPQSDPAGELYRRFLDASGRTRQVHKWHHYFDIYERHFAPFRGAPVTVLEIGVFRGGSLELWRSYFGSAARIVGLDIDPACTAFAGPGVEVFTGDQTDPVFLRRVLAEAGSPHVVIDDGGHTMNQMIASFEAIYPAMPAPAVYLIEDTHTCFWGGEFRDRADGLTFLDYAAERCRDLHGWTGARDAFARLGKPPSARLPHEAPPVSDVCRSTGSIHFYDSVVVFERRNRTEPWHEVR